MLKGSLHKLQANKLRLFQNRVNFEGVIFDNDTDFGTIECTSSVNSVTSIVDVSKPKFDLSHLNDLNNFRR